MLLSIVKYPDLMLRKKTVPVDKITKEIFILVDNMIETMLKEDGLGLAANQVGSTARIFVINTAPSGEEPKPLAAINPVVLDQEGNIIAEEGCLSFPELYLKIARPENIRIQARSLYNESFILDTTGVLARAVMHEIDHLNGILFIDHADKIERAKLKKYLENIMHSVQK